MTSPKLWQCDNCKVVVPLPDLECPYCGMPDATYTGVDPHTFEWTPEAKEATHAFANEAVETETFRTCMAALKVAVLRPLNLGKEVPITLQRHYVNQLISIAAISVYSGVCGVPLEDLEVSGEQLAEVVEGVLEELGREGYEGNVTWREGEGGYIVAELDSQLPGARQRAMADILGRLGSDILDRLDSDEPVVIAGLPDGAREELVNKAARRGIDNLHAGQHEDYGAWVGNVDLEEALEEAS